MFSNMFNFIYAHCPEPRKKPTHIKYLYQFKNINDDQIWLRKLKQETGCGILSLVRVSSVQDAEHCALSAIFL